MRGTGAAVLESEDEWTSADEKEFQDIMVSAEEAVPVPFRSLGELFGPIVVPNPVYPIWRMEALGWRLEFNPPVLVTVENDGDEIIVSNSDLRMWGEGPDKYQALADFSRTFVSVLSSYEDAPADGLTPDAVQYRAKLQSLIQQRETV